MNTRTVVKFMSDHSVEAVPTKWLSEDYCLWPNYTKEKLLKAIRICEPALPSWERHKISTFRNATYGDYTIARKKCRQAEVTSDLNSETERKRVTKKPCPVQQTLIYQIQIVVACFTNEDSSLPKYPEINLKKTVILSVNVDKNSRILITNIDTDGSAQVHGKTKECSMKEVEDGIKKILRRAKERHVVEEKRSNQMR